MWLIALCLIASATALFVDESVFAINNSKFFAPFSDDFLFIVKI